MRNIAPILLLIIGAARAEDHTLTLRQAVNRSMEQNPDLAMARLDERKAQESVRQAKDPFWPKLAVGSGLAYSNGFPMSIEGSAPSIIQARASESFFNRPQSYLVAQARENSRGAAIAVLSKRDEVALRTAGLYLDLERGARLAQVARTRIDSLERVLEIVRLQVAEGLELPVMSKRAELLLEQARYHAQVQDSDSAYLEGLLATVLGFGARDRVLPVLEERPIPEMPTSDEEAVKIALGSSPEIKRLESSLLAKGFEVRSQKAAWLPRVDLVAQYALFGQYNNYQDYFRTFQRNNGEIGVSLQLPVLNGPGVKAAASQAEADAAKLRLQIVAARNRITLETRRDYNKIKEAEMARNVARLDLDVARDQLSLLLAQMGEGRATLRQIEEARVIETEKWMAYYDGNYNLEKARLGLLSETGALLAALK